MLLLPGTDRYSVVATVPGNGQATVRGQFDQDASGGVLTARTTAEHINAICHLHTLLLLQLADDAAGLEACDDEAVAAAAFIGVELHQLLLATARLSLEIDEEIHEQVCGSLAVLRRQLTHLRDLHIRSHDPARAFLPEYFAFIAANPIPGGDDA